MGDYEERFGGEADDGTDGDGDGGLVDALGRIGQEWGVPSILGAVRPGGAGAAQLDLNDENNLGDLEDPGLAEHMRRARETLTDHERIRAGVPGSAALDARDLEARRLLSTTTTELNSGGMALRCACDNVLVQATNVGRLLAGETPHGFPAANRALPSNGALSRNLVHMTKKLNEAGSALETLVTNLQGLERNLALTRRAYEAVVDGLRLRCADLEASAKNNADPARSGGRGSQDAQDELDELDGF